MKSRTLIASLAVVVAGLAGAQAQAAIVYANTSDGRLVSFDSATPTVILSNVAISGVTGSLAGIDFRPAGGGLYGLGVNGNAGTVYTIDRLTGSASAVYSLTTPLAGTSFGVDFNPVPDALRIVSDTQQNLRIAGFPTGSFTTNGDGALSLAGVVASAYTNNFAGATTTTLYDIRSTDSSLYTQNPPNNGTLNLVGALGTGTSNLVGFDIASDGVAYASLSGGAYFGTIDLLTGAFNYTGSVGGRPNFGSVVGISVVPVPEPATLAMLGLGFAAMLGTRKRRQRRA